MTVITVCTEDCWVAVASSLYTLRLEEMGQASCPRNIWGTQEQEEDTVRYVEFAGWRLSKVGLGTSQFANPGWGYGADHKPHELVRTALAHGITHFDTSTFYGAGHSERILGAATGNAEGVLVATK